MQALSCETAPHAYIMTLKWISKIQLLTMLHEDIKILISSINSYQKRKTNVPVIRNTNGSILSCRDIEAAGLL